MKYGYRYERTKDGFIRHKLMGDEDRFIAKILEHKGNVGWLRKLYRIIVCNVYGHTPSKISLQKGINKKDGEFEVIMCAKCRGLVYYYSGGIDE